MAVSEKTQTQTLEGLQILLSWVVLWKYLDPKAQQEVFDNIRPAAESLGILYEEGADEQAFLDKFATAVRQITENLAAIPEIAEKFPQTVVPTPDKLGTWIKDMEARQEREMEIIAKTRARMLRTQDQMRYFQLQQAIGQALEKNPKFFQDPHLIKPTAIALTPEVINNIPVVLDENALSQDDYAKAMARGAEMALKNRGISIPIEEITQEVLPQLKKIATAPRLPIRRTSGEIATAVAARTPRAEARARHEAKVALPLAVQAALIETKTISPSLETHQASKKAAEVIRFYLEAKGKGPILESEYRKLIAENWRAIRIRLNQNGIFAPPESKKAEALINAMVKASKKQARILSSGSGIPGDIQKRLAQGIAPSRNAFQAFMNFALTPLKAFVGMAVDAKIDPASPKREAFEFILQGGTEHDIDATDEHFKKLGVPETHRTRTRLKEFRAEVIQVRYQPVVDDQGHEKLDAAGQTTPDLSRPTLGARLLALGKPAGAIKAGDIYLTKRADSPKEGTLRWKVSELITRLQLATFWEKVEVRPGCSVLQNKITTGLARILSGGQNDSLRGILISVYQNTVGRAISFVGSKIGDQIKARLKDLGVKIGTSLLKGLGISLGEGGIVAAIGTALGVSVPVAGAIITGLVWIGSKILKPLLKKILDPIKMFIHNIFSKPEWALAATLGSAALIGLGIGGTAGLIIGGIIGTAGLAGLATIGISSAGLILGSIGGGITGFFTAILTLPAATAGVALLVVGVLGTLATITFFIVILTASAFMVPGTPGPTGATPPTFGTAVAARNPEDFAYLDLAERLLFTLQECGITHVNTQTLPAVANCLEEYHFPNRDRIMAQFQYSVDEVGGGLQCVGFVRAITAALGRDIEGGRNARDYLNPPTPAGYNPVNTNMDEVAVGDIVIMGGTTYGHMGIVVDSYRDEDGNLMLKVAQAWGTHNGLIQVTEEVRAIWFDGFLSPIYHPE